MDAVVEHWPSGKVSKFPSLSRPATDDVVPVPYANLFQVAAQQAQQVEVLLLRSLLVRAYGVLQDVAIESRAAGERNAITEILLHEISIVIDKPPTLI